MVMGSGTWVYGLRLLVKVQGLELWVMGYGFRVKVLGVLGLKV
jgi:hypothetical protein